MNPTMKLRWNKIEGSFKYQPMVMNAYDHRFVLQQWWAVFREGQEMPTGEWRDIQIEQTA